MGLRAFEKRELAEKCISLAFDKEFQSAAKIRQEAYALNPPGSIGIDWNNWETIWKFDSRYLKYLLDEDYSDCENTERKIEYIQSGIFIDYLFDFRDCWGVLRQAEIYEEQFISSKLQKYLLSQNWIFESENPEIIYTNTKKKNISARIYYDSIKENGFNDIARPIIFGNGEYDLGFPPNADEKIVEGRRKWLKNYNMFLSMQKAGIEKFPKTFQTFEKHRIAQSNQYQKWISQYLNF